MNFRNYLIQGRDDEWDTIWPGVLLRGRRKLIILAGITWFILCVDLGEHTGNIGFREL